MKILIYGFGPYGQYLENVTENNLYLLMNREKNFKAKNVFLHVFDTKFDRGMFEAKLDKIKPDIVIGLGQHSRARKLRIERKAINWMCHHRSRPGSRKGQRIEKGFEKEVFLKHTLPETELTTVTYDAGTYVCNYSMWIVAKWCEGHGAKSAFVHVPINYNTVKLVGYIKRTLNFL